MDYWREAAEIVRPVEDEEVRRMLPLLTDLAHPDTYIGDNNEKLVFQQCHDLIERLYRERAVEMVKPVHADHVVEALEWLNEHRGEGVDAVKDTLNRLSREKAEADKRTEESRDYAITEASKLQSELTATEALVQVLWDEMTEWTRTDIGDSHPEHRDRINRLMGEKDD